MCVLFAVHVRSGSLDLAMLVHRNVLLYKYIFYVLVSQRKQNHSTVFNQEIINDQCYSQSHAMLGGTRTPAFINSSLCADVLKAVWKIISSEICSVFSSIYANVVLQDVCWFCCTS